MKTIRVISRKNGILCPQGGNEITSARIHNSVENWIIEVDTQEADRHTDREMSEITVTMHNGQVWTGTIQCLAAIRDFAHNAQLALCRANCANQEDKDEAFKDVTALLWHFSKSDCPHHPATELATLKQELKRMQERLFTLSHDFTGNKRMYDGIQRTADLVLEAENTLGKTLNPS